MATKLKAHKLQTFKDGYNSYPASKTAVKDTEVPYGINTAPDDNGSFGKRLGKDVFGDELSSGHSVKGMGWFKTSSINKVLVACNTTVYDVTSTTTTALTGVTFTADKETHFCQAFSNASSGSATMFVANNTDNLAYTINGTSLTAISSNGNIGHWPVFFNQRIYMTNSTNPDRIYYSNPFALTLSANPPTLAGLDVANLFNTALGDTPPKNAGYIVLNPGAGVEITRLIKVNQQGTEYLLAFTKRHGLWRIAFSAIAADDSVTHTVSQFITHNGSPAGNSVFQVANDTWFFGHDNMYSVGEQAQYQNIRVSTKSGRVKTEMQAIPAGYRDEVAGVFYKTKAYIAYTNGTYNDRVLVWNSILNAWSTPYQSWNVSQFLEWEDDSGNRKLLAGSSDSSDSFVYELETGNDDDGAAISGTFETKSTDCKLPGIVKRFAFIDVFYSMVYGTLTYEVFVDETSSITGALQLGNSTSLPIGFGSQIFGSFLHGLEYDSATTFADLEQNSQLRIDCLYTPGYKISVRFTNAVSGEQFKIDGIVVHFQQGSVYETA